MIFDDLPKLDFVDRSAELLKDSNIDHKPLRWVDAAWLRDRFWNILLHIDYYAQGNDIKDEISYHPSSNFRWFVGNTYDNLLFKNQDGGTDGVFSTDPFAGIVGEVKDIGHIYNPPDELRVQLIDNPLDLDSYDRQMTQQDMVSFKAIESAIDGDFWVASYMAFELQNVSWSKSKYGNIEDAPEWAGFFCDWYETFDEEGRPTWVGHSSMISDGEFHSYEYEEGVKTEVTKGVDGGFSFYVAVVGQERRTTKLSDGSWGPDRVIYGTVLKRLDLTWNREKARFECSIGNFRQMIFDAANDLGMTLLQGLPGPSNERVYQYVRIDNDLSPIGWTVCHLKSSDSQ